MTKNVILELLLPFLGTSLGAGCVFFLKRGMNLLVQRALTGFAAGVMVAASVWSLLVPAMEQAEDMGQWAFFPAVAGFWLGVLFLLVLDRTIPHLHQNSSQPEGPHTRLKRTTMLVLAVTLHNIPEGMAVGVVLAGWMAGNDTITATATMALSIGIAIQNFPEGAIISMPLQAEGVGKGRAFPIRRSLRHRGAFGGGPDHAGGRTDPARSALSARFCCGSDDLCSSGATDPGGIRRGTFQPGNDVLRGGIYHHAGAGCGVGIKGA